VNKEEVVQRSEQNYKDGNAPKCQVVRKNSAAVIDKNIPQDRRDGGIRPAIDLPVSGSKVSGRIPQSASGGASGDCSSCEWQSALVL
jgi:hypothetical protein